MLFMLAGSVAAASYRCPSPLSAATVACTFASIGGTTTYTAVVTAQTTGSVMAGSAVALFVTLDGEACNENFGIPVPVAGGATSATVTGRCTFDVPSDRLVNLVAVAQSQNGSPAFISLEANSIAFVTDAILTVATSGSGTITSLDGRIDCGLDCSESYAANTTVTLFAN